MKIVDILIDSANLLGLTDDVKAMKILTVENEQTALNENPNVENLFSLLKFSLKELCTNYVPIVTTQNIRTEDKQYPLSNLKNFIRIQNVYQNEQLMKFKIINRNLMFVNDGEYMVKYSTYPEIKSMFEDIDFLHEFSPDVIVFGLCAYYALVHGRFDEFEKFHESYVDKAESLKNLKIFDMPVRRWE